MAAEITDLFLQAAFAIAALALFFAIGRFICRWCKIEQRASSRFGPLFYSLLTGMISVITVYAVITSVFKTVFIMALVALIILIALQRRTKHHEPGDFLITRRHFLWPVMLIIVFVLLLNFLPESQYKQYDSFFYLKISETLNIAGQENLSNYYNLLNNSYHGVEAYHYVELWLNAFLLRFTSYVLPNIQAFRIVTFVIIGVIFTLGLFHLSETINRKPPSTLQKILCISLLFLHLDVVSYLPENIRRYIVFSFESNFIERPNFRVIYLFIIPVVDLLWRNVRDSRWLFFLILLSLSNPLLLLIIVPSVIITWLIQRVRKREVTFPLSQLLLFLGFVVAYILFYLLLAPEHLPAAYQPPGYNLAAFYSSSWKFVALTIFTSLAYVALLLSLIHLLFRSVFKRYTVNFKQHKEPTTLLISMCIVGVVIARLGTFAENAYQVAFGGYIAISVIIFIMFMAAGDVSRMAAVLLIAFSCLSFIILRTSNGDYENVFHPRNAPAYNNTNYSPGYIDAVADHVKQNNLQKGAFIADSTWYSQHYYSVRNPNVYHLPITYVLANRTRSNVDFCLSSREAIFSHPENKLERNAYLVNALERSLFHKSYHSGDHAENVARFVRDNRIGYLFLSPGVQVPPTLSGMVATTITDRNTGETFVVLGVE